MRAVTQGGRLEQDMAEHHLDVDFILDVAAEEFAAHGYEGFSMRSLGDKCRVTAAAIYYHFQSKEHLYEEMCNRLFDDVVTTINSRLKGAADPAARMELFVSALFDIWDNRTLLILTQRDVINATIYPDRSFSSPHYKLLFALIAKIQSQFVANELSEPLSFALGSMLFGYCSLLVYSHHDSKLSWDAHRDKRKAELLGISRMFVQRTMNRQQNIESRSA